MLITVNVQVFIIMVLFILTKQIKIYSILMVFTLVHELAHMLMGIVLKLRPKELNVNPFGFSILFETYEKSEKKKFLVAISGPLANIVVALLIYFINPKNEWRELIIYSNVLIGLFKLIPIYPLDGGRILKSILRRKYGWKKTDKIVNTVSNIITIALTACCSILILIYHNIGLLLVLAYLWILNVKENKRYMLKMRVYRAIENANFQKPIDKKV